MFIIIIIMQCKFQLKARTQFILLGFSGYSKGILLNTQSGWSSDWYLLPPWWRGQFLILLKLRSIQKSP